MLIHRPILMMKYMTVNLSMNSMHWKINNR